jgi:hypothetical protein
MHFGYVKSAKPPRRPASEQLSALIVRPNSQNPLQMNQTSFAVIAIQFFPAATIFDCRVGLGAKQGRANNENNQQQ